MSKRRRAAASAEDSPAAPKSKQQARAPSAEPPEDDLQTSLKSILLSSWSNHASPLAWAVASVQAAGTKRAEADELLCDLLLAQLAVTPSGSPLLLDYICYAYTAGMLPAAQLVAKVECAQLKPRISCQILARTARVASCKRLKLDLAARCRLLVAATRALSALSDSFSKPIIQQWCSSGSLVPLLLAAPHEIPEEWASLQQIAQQATVAGPLQALVAPVKIDWLPEHCETVEADWPTSALRVFLGCCLISGGENLSDQTTADTLALYARLVGDSLGTAGNEQLWIAMVVRAAVTVCIDFDGMSGATFKTGVFMLHQVPRIVALLAKHSGLQSVALEQTLTDAVKTASSAGSPSFIELLSRGLVWYRLLPPPAPPLIPPAAQPPSGKPPKAQLEPRQDETTPAYVLTPEMLPTWRPKQPTDLLAAQLLVPQLVSVLHHEAVVTVVVKSGQERAELMPDVLKWLMGLITQGTGNGLADSGVQPWLLTFCGVSSWTSHSFKGLARAAHTLGMLGQLGTALERLCGLLGQLTGPIAHKAFGAMLVGVLVVGSEDYGRLLWQSTEHAAGVADLAQWGLDLTRHCFVERAESVVEGSVSKSESTALLSQLLHKNEHGVLAMQNTVTPRNMLTRVVPQLMLQLRTRMQLAQQQGSNSTSAELEILNLLQKCIGYSAVPMLLLQLEWLCHAPVQLPITKILKQLLQRFLQSIDKQLVASVKLLQVPLLFVNRFLMGGNSPPQDPLLISVQLRQTLQQAPATSSELSPVMALQSMTSRATWPMQVLCVASGAVCCAAHSLAPPAVLAPAAVPPSLTVSSLAAQVDILAFDAIKLVIEPPAKYSRSQAALALSSVVVMTKTANHLFGAVLWRAIIPGWVETDEQAAGVALCMVSTAAQLGLHQETVGTKVEVERISFQALCKLMHELLLRGPNEMTVLDALAIHFFGFIGRVSAKWLVRIACSIGQTDLRRALLRHGDRCRSLIAMCHDMEDSTQRHEYLHDVFSK